MCKIYLWDLRFEKKNERVKDVLGLTKLVFWTEKWVFINQDTRYFVVGSEIIWFLVAKLKFWIWNGIVWEIDFRKKNYSFRNSSLFCEEKMFVG